MPIGISQNARRGSFSCVLGPDELVLRRFKGVERMNGLGEMVVDLQFENGPPDLDALIGTHGTLSVRNSWDGTARFFDGIITEAEPPMEYTALGTLRLTLRPWFWLATLRKNQKIFHNKSVPDIIAAVLADYAFPNTPTFSKTHAAIEYVVQYGESDFAFLSRLMEMAGISYHFAHSDGEHKLVLTDTTDDLPQAGGGARLFLAADSKHVGMGEFVSDVVSGRGLTTGRVVLTDYNFKTPTVAMKVEQTGDAAYANGQLESFVYPGGYLRPAEGRTVARLRTDQARSGDGRSRAKGDLLSIWPGMRFGIAGAQASPADGTYVLAEAWHEYDEAGYRSGDSDPRPQYEGRYGFQAETAPVVPAQVTPPARISGPQTATVVGAGEIDCDEYGRILVKFHWDREGANSMRCRVAQIWAGSGWGGMAIPRVGMEVVVEFLNGDPDQPLVIGCVYNARNMPPYPLPGQKSRATLKSQSHEGAGFNELRLEDQSGQEEIFVHAQKDMNTKVLNNHTLRVDNNAVDSIGANKMVEVLANLTHVVGGGITFNVGGAYKNTVVDGGAAGNAEGVGAVATGNGTAVAAGDMVTNIEKNTVTTIGANETTDIGADQTLTVGGSCTETISNDWTHDTGANHTQTVGGDQVIDVSGNTAQNTGSNHNIDAGDSIVLTTGSAKIVMKKNGDILIKGKNLIIDMSGSIVGKAGKDVGLKASGNVAIKGSKVAHN